MVLGSFVNCIHKCEQSAQKLLDIIVSNFSHFKDEAVYNNITGNGNFFYNIFICEI